MYNSYSQAGPGPGPGPGPARPAPRCGSAAAAARACGMPFNPDHLLNGCTSAHPYKLVNTPLDYQYGTKGLVSHCINCGPLH
jgi:hypothetical protein